MPIKSATKPSKLFNEIVTKLNNKLKIKTDELEEKIDEKNERLHKMNEKGEDHEKMAKLSEEIYE